MTITKQDVFDYHRRGLAGKIEDVPTKPLLTQTDSSLAYTPGVAEAWIASDRNPVRATGFQVQPNPLPVTSTGRAIPG